MSQIPKTPPLTAAETRLFLVHQWRLNQTLGRHLTPLIEARHGVSLKNLLMLGHIQAGIQYPTELAEALQMPRHMASRAIDDLLGGGLIERRIDEADSRRTRLTVSPAGLKVMEAAQHTVDDSLNELFARIPAARRAQVQSALELLAQAAQDAFGSRP